MNKINVFPRDSDTLCIIKEVENYIGLENKEIEKLNYTELLDYIELITLMLLEKQHDKKY